jgi:hypothetical protein
MEIRSFSGTHPWHPTVLLDTDAHEAGTADDIIENIESGRCPRCEGPLPTLPEFPAGSRATLCRSIPICGRCGGDEVYEQLSCGISSAGCWPVPVEEIEERRAYFEGKDTVAILSGDVLITDDGAVPIVNPRNTGGWAHFGSSSE